MKNITIICIAILIMFLYPTSVSGNANRDTTDGLPQLFDLRDNPDGVVTIAEPAGYDKFEAAAVSDMDGDGYDDIIAKGVEVNQESDVEFFIIYGMPHPETQLSMDDPVVRTSSIRWEDATWVDGVDPVKTGDINGDGRLDICYFGRADKLPTRDIGVYIILNPGDWKSSSAVSIGSPGFSKYFLTSQALKVLRTFEVADMNGDGKDDIIAGFVDQILQGYLSSVSVGKIYIVYSKEQIAAEINMDDTRLSTIKVQDDTLYSYGFGSIAVGDFDKDNRNDILTDGGSSRLGLILPSGSREQWMRHRPTYLIYGSILNPNQYMDKLLNLEERSLDVVPFVRYSKTVWGQSDYDLDHNVASGDINGDGYDEVVIGYHNDADGVFFNQDYAETFILFGKSDRLFSGDIDNMGGETLKLRSAYKDDGMGIEFDFADINGDGYQDCLIEAIQNRFYVLYGRSEFPDSLVISSESQYLSAVSGGELTACGDINGDGYQDMVTNVAEGISIILGRGAEYKAGETIVRPMPRSIRSKYKFHFDNGTDFQFHFTKGTPFYTSELHLTNLGTQLPESHQSVPLTENVAAIFDVEITEMEGRVFKAQCSFGYTDSLVSMLGIQEKDLTASYWDEENGWWSKIWSAVDTVRNTVTFETDHFSLFALVDINDPIVADINEADAQVPLTFELLQNYPNPFNPVTTIEYSLPKRSKVTLEIYNLLGQRVRTLIDESKPAGSRSVQWDGRNDEGISMSSGMYFYKLRAGEFSKTRKMLLVR